MTPSADPWYEQLREHWRPPSVRFLLIGESAPGPGAEDRRFFYAPTLDRRDNLFRGVVAAFYGPIPPGSTGQPKEPWLQCLKRDGVFLIDLVPRPVDKLPPAARRAARNECANKCASEAAALRPEGVIVCHGPTFEALSSELRAAEVPLLHDEAIPFPLGNHRARFVTMVRQASDARVSSPRSTADSGSPVTGGTRDAIVVQRALEPHLCGALVRPELLVVVGDPEACRWANGVLSPGHRTEPCPSLFA